MYVPVDSAVLARYSFGGSCAHHDEVQITPHLMKILEHVCVCVCVCVEKNNISYSQFIPQAGCELLCTALQRTPFLDLLEEVSGESRNPETRNAASPQDGLKSI